MANILVLSDKDQIVFSMPRCDLVAYWLFFAIMLIGAVSPAICYVVCFVWNLALPHPAPLRFPIGVFLLSIVGLIGVSALVRVATQEEWFQAVFVIDKDGISKKMPSGRETYGRWDQLQSVDIWRRRLLFKDGTAIRLSFWSTASFRESEFRLIAHVAGESSVFAQSLAKATRTKPFKRGTQS